MPEMPFDEDLARKLTHKWKLRLWMLKKLSMGFLSGMRIEKLSMEGCKVVLKDRWWIRNPFGSVFWAVMGMAAELSTGSLLFAYASGHKVQFILIEMKAKFYRKARGKSFYFCHAGSEVEKVLTELQNIGETRILQMPVLALNISGETIAEFEFYWQIRKPII